jgi:hypothetical protein
MCGRVRLSSDCQRDQARLLDPAASADPEYRAELEPSGPPWVQLPTRA